MTPKERQLAAIRREPIDRTPIDAIWVYNQKAIADYLKIDQKQVLEYLGLDGRPILLEYENEFSERSDEAGAIFWSTTLFEGGVIRVRSCNATFHFFRRSSPSSRLSRKKHRSQAIGLDILRLRHSLCGIARPDPGFFWLPQDGCGRDD